MVRTLALALLLTSLALAENPLAIPHVADGGGWRSTITIFNSYAHEEARVQLKFRAGDGSLLDMPLLNYGLVRTLELELAVDSSVYLETAGVQPNVRTGWVEVNQLSGAVPVRAFAVFRQTVPGRPDFEAISLGTRAASAITFPFDNTSGSTTSFAAANLGNTACSVAVSPIRDEAGRSLAPAPRAVFSLLANGHTSFISTDLMPELAGKRGYLQFYPSFGCGSGGIAMVGLRFNSFGPFTNLVPLSATSPF
jgi:hypothetical protein